MSLMAIITKKCTRGIYKINSSAHELDFFIDNVESDGMTKKIIDEAREEVKRAEDGINDLKKWLTKAEQIMEIGNTEVTEEELRTVYKRKLGGKRNDSRVP